MLKIDNVSYRYKNSKQDVLKSISVEFESGKVHAILGPSGSGKTTLLSIMAGLDRPGDGEVFIDGNSLVKMDLDEYRRKHVAMIFQSYQLFPLLTAMENVCFPMMLNNADKNEARQQANEYLNRVGIDEGKHRRYPSNLSGGEQQRVAIARALSSGAKLILADEPTGNLDVENGTAVFTLLQNLAHEMDYCVIIVTHNLEIAEASDKVHRISDGVLHG